MEIGKDPSDGKYGTSGFSERRETVKSLLGSGADFATR
jgi:hypothetical protein